MKHIHQLLKAKTLKSSAAITIPANTVMFIHGKLADMNCRDENSYSSFVEPNRNLLLDYGIVVDPAFCLTNHRQVPVRVTNLTDLPFFLYKNSTVGRLEPISNNCDKIKSAKISESGRLVEKDHYKNKKPTEKVCTKERLWRELKIDDIRVVNPRQREQLKSLVWEFRHNFSKGPFDLGECNTFEGGIELKRDYTPSWIPARPAVPYNLRKEMDSQIEGLLHAGVIFQYQS